MSRPSLDDRLARRRAGRLGAVQALYQIEIASQPPEVVLGQFIAHRHGPEVEVAEDETQHAEADMKLLQELVLGCCRRQSEIDGLIADALDEAWPFDRIEAVMRAILRVAAYELLARPVVPARVIIAEYVDLAFAYYDDKEPGMVNAVLDRLARVLRSEEMTGPPLPKAGALSR